VETRRLVTLKEAADRLSISTDTLRRKYKHQFVQVSQRRLAMRLSDVLNAVGQ
jgi:hypothetical protein